MMTRFILASAILLAAVAPAHATGGFVCRTSGARPLQATVGFGHVAGAALLKDVTRLTDNGRNVPVSAPQWWLDNSELRLLLVDPNATRREAIIKARRNGHFYDGSIWRGGKRRWIRCREG